MILPKILTKSRANSPFTPCGEGVGYGGHSESGGKFSHQTCIDTEVPKREKASRGKPFL